MMDTGMISEVTQIRVSDEERLSGVPGQLTVERALAALRDDG